VIAVVIGLLASVAGMRRAVTVDPALAFGGP
jgi:putative ABC transport system permease protein